MFDTIKQKLIEQRSNGYMIRFSLSEAFSPENEAGWEYEETLVTDLHSSTVTTAIIRSQYSADAELSLISDYLSSGTSPQWEAYQDFRHFAISYTRDTLGLA